MFTVLFIGDPHFRIDNIPDVNLFLSRLQTLATERKPDLICIGGDLLHTHERLHTVPLNKAYELVENMRKISPTIVLVGNHDMLSNQEYLNENHWMNGMKEWENVTIVDKVHHLHTKGYHFTCCPYVYAGRFIEALNTHETDWKTSDCIFAHQEFYGCSMESITSVEGDKWDLSYPDVVSGHIHGRQKLQENIYYSGSAMQHTFGETGKKVIALLHFEKPGQKYTLEEVNLKLPRKRVVHTDIESIDEDYKVKPEESKDKVKISITGNYEEFKAFKKTKKYKEIIRAGTKVVFKPKKLVRKKVKKGGKEGEPKEEVKIDESSFSTILQSLISAERSTYLYQVYEQVINGKNISEEDLFFPG